MVNNFEFLKNVLHFDSYDRFYFIELLKRKKDNPDMSKSQKMIDFYEVSSLEEYDNLKDKIIQKCHYHNCRAYLSVNPRSRKKIALEMLRTISSRIADNDYNVRNIYHSMLGKFMASSIDKLWIVDIDYQEYDVLRNVVTLIKKIKPEFTYYSVPTINGFHLLCPPFNSKEFAKLCPYPEVSIHTNNSTLLYFNKCGK